MNAALQARMARPLQRACAALAVGWAAVALAHASGWSDDDVRASRVEGAVAATAKDEPRAPADAAALLVVADGDGRHLTLVDGERLEIVRRVATRALLPSAPRLGPDRRHVYVGSTDGWITKLDLRTLAVAAEVRAGLELRAIALSGDGQWLLAGNVAPHTVAIFDADLKLVKSFAAAPRDAATTSRVAAVADATARQSFVVVLQDLPEVWEISYNPRAEDIFDGLVHDYRMGEGVPLRGFLNRRRSLLAAPLTAEARNIAFDRDFTSVLGVVPAPDGGSLVQVLNLDVRRRIAAIAVPGAPRLDEAIALDWDARRVLAAPSAATSAIDVVDANAWRFVQAVATPEPVQFLSRRAGGRFAWAVGAPGSGGSRALIVLDPASLQAAPASGAPRRSCGAIVFGGAAGHAWAPPCTGDAELVVRHAETLEPLRRLPLAPEAAPR